MNGYFVIASFYCFFSIVFIGLGIQEEIKKKAPFRYGEESEYCEVSKLDEQCWVKALKHLEVLRADPEVTGAAMILGSKNQGGHAWIEYKKKDEIIKYDPTTNKVLLIERKK